MFLKYQKEKEYEKTYEYKLLDIGYEKNQVNDILKTFKDKEIDYILTKEVSNNYLELSKTKYFIYDKFYQYVDYLEKNKNKNLRDIVEIVNTNTDKDYYTDTTKTDIDKKYLMLVNKYHYLEESYTPESLVSIPPTYSYGEYGSQKATEDTYNAFLNLWNASHEAGFYLMVNSSYRTYAEQQEVYDDYRRSGGEDYADSIAARPGYSEHQTGYTLDVFEKGYSQKDFETSDSYNWLKENAYKYGFILRYSKEKENITGYSFESWHIRYVGIDAAKVIYENNITFDEYYAYFVK